MNEMKKREIVYFFLQMWQINFGSPIGCTSLKWRFKMCCRENRLWHWWHSKLRFSSSKWRSMWAVNVRFSWNFFGHFVQLKAEKKIDKNLLLIAFDGFIIVNVLKSGRINMPGNMLDDSTSREKFAIATAQKWF